MSEQQYVIKHAVKEAKAVKRVHFNAVLNNEKESQREMKVRMDNATLDYIK